MKKNLKLCTVFLSSFVVCLFIMTSLDATGEEVQLSGTAASFFSGLASLQKGLVGARGGAGLVGHCVSSLASYAVSYQSKQFVRCFFDQVSNKKFDSLNQRLNSSKNKLKKTEKQLEGTHKPILTFEYFLDDHKKKFPKVVFPLSNVVGKNFCIRSVDSVLQSEIGILNSYSSSQGILVDFLS